MALTIPASAAGAGRTPPPSPPECPTERMSPVDRAWLQMDDARNPMIVSAILELDGPVRMATLRKAITERLLRHPRFRQRADDGHGPAQWVPDADMNLDYHVRVATLPPRCTDAQLREIVAGELAAELDRGLPLWRMSLYRRGRDGAVAVFRAHHAMGDGMALLRVLLECADTAPPLPPAPAEAESAHGFHTGPLGRLIDRLETLNDVLADLRELALDDLRHPAHAAAQIAEGRRVLGAIRRVLALPDDNPPALRRELSGQRAVAWSGGLPFAPIKRLARAHGVTVNDVFMAALAGAFGRYLRETQGTPTGDANLRVSIPVNLRAGGDGAAGNHFGLVLADLPIGAADAEERLRLVAARMDALKHSPEARAVLVALAAAGHMTAGMERRLVGLVGAKAVAVVSNLPGPREHLAIAGARLARLVFWPPQAGGIGIGISLFSYAGEVGVGVSADTALIPEPQRLIDAFEAELRSMTRPARRRSAAAAKAPA